jgi:yecA family protein
MSRYEAYIEKAWREHGLAHLVVARLREDGSADVGVFLVDVWCLGVKDAFGESDLLESELREFVEERLPESMREPIHPTCAKKLIEGALAFAETLGFAPHRDFRKARRVLSSLDASLCPMEFTYGREGRPYYVRGPNDSEERVDRVLAILEARVGPEGYDYDPAEDEETTDLAEVREALINLLAAEPPEVPRFYFLSGMITALHLCPRPVPPLKLLEALWPEGRAWESQEELEGFTALLTEYWNYAGELVSDATAPDAPAGTQAFDVWSEDFPTEHTLPMMAALVEWAGGFLRATELWPEAWENALARPDLAPHWEVIRWWRDLVQPGNKDRIADAAEGTPSRTIAASVVALARALRPAGAALDGN